MSDLSKGLDWFLDNTDKFQTVYSVISDNLVPRQTIVEKPTAGYPEGVNSAPTNNIINQAADVITQGKDFYTQVKGLFGLGYPATEPQPVSAVKHELTATSTPASQTALSLPAGISPLMLAAGAIVLLMLLKK